MKVTVITSEWGDECRHGLAIKVDGEKKFEVSDGEPEDSNLCRDFNDCYLIPGLMQMAYEAGKRGESLEIERTEEDDG
jgi:hypothetical protein